jgi:hypothetical protein
VQLVTVDQCRLGDTPQFVEFGAINVRSSQRGRSTLNLFRSSRSFPISPSTLADAACTGRMDWRSSKCSATIDAWRRRRVCNRMRICCRLQSSLGNPCAAPHRRGGHWPCKHQLAIIQSSADGHPGTLRSGPGETATRGRRRRNGGRSL